jgi:hypothetical protein
MDWISYGFALGGIGIALWIAISFHRIAARLGASVQAVDALTRSVGQLRMYAPLTAPPRSAPASRAEGRNLRQADEEEEERSGEEDEREEDDKVTVTVFDKEGNPRPKE